MYEDSTVFIGVDSSVSVLTDPIFITVHMILFNVFYQVMIKSNKAGYTATLVACGWVGAVLKKVTRASGQELYAQKAQKRQKSKKGTYRPTDPPPN